jgi:hypothetical protein
VQRGAKVASYLITLKGASLLGNANVSTSMQTLVNYPRTPFHGDNMGSNPIGDTTHINKLEAEATSLPFGGDAMVTN